MATIVASPTPVNATSSASLPSIAPQIKLTRRRVGRQDVEELKRMREACGWGSDQVESQVERNVDGQEYLLWVFEDEETGDAVGMGAVDLVDPYEDDRELCDPSRGIVMISSLFVYQKYRRFNLGNRIMDILEKACRDELGAKTATVNTREYEEDGSMNKNKAWYLRRGFVEFRPPAPRYELDDGSKLVACFLRKELANL